MSKATVLINLGSPDSAKVADVRKYLAQFLMDRHVIDVPWPIRAMIVYAFILPFRSPKSAEAYQSIWSSEGSPLIAYSQKLYLKLKQDFSKPLSLAMTYGKPSVQEAVDDLLDQGYSANEPLRLVPLFPHYAESSYGAAVDAFKVELKRRKWDCPLEILPPFYEHPDYIHCLAKSIEPYLNQGFDRLLLSYHGLPERHILKADPTAGHCFKQSDCCAKPSEALQTCYRAQVFKTSQKLREALSLSEDFCLTSFQSRLGVDSWLKPYTENMLKDLAAQGVKKLLIASPAFVADCLETLEELQIRGRETFLEAGGEELLMIPCLNDRDDWTSVLKTWLV